MNPDGPLFEKFANGNKKVHFVKFSKNPLSYFREFLRLRRLLKLISPDIVHTWLYMSDFSGGLAAYTLRKPKLYWSIRQSNVSFSQNRLHTFFIIRLCGMLSRFLPDRIISCSEVAKDVHAANCFYKRSKIEVIPNGFDTKKLRFNNDDRNKFRKELGIQKGKANIIGFIGRYDVQKGVDNFINIAKLIREEIKDSSFVFVGPGCASDNEELMALMQTSGISEVSYLLGSRNDVQAILSGIDLLIIPSRGEAFPNILGEAMSVGTPVVTTNVGEIPIILQDIQACFVPGDNLNMAKAAVGLLRMDESSLKRYSSILRERIIERYNYEMVMEMYKEAYT